MRNGHTYIYFLLICFSMVKKKIPMLTSTIVGPDEILKYIEMISPAMQETRPNTEERTKSRLMLDAMFFAAAAGTMRRDVTSIMPTIFRLTVITIAIRKKSRYSKNLTFIPSILARSVLNVIWRKGLSKKRNVAMVRIVITSNNKRSVEVMARISPNKYVKRSTLYPLSMAIMSIPEAIAAENATPMTVSCESVVFSERNAMKRAIRTAITIDEMERSMPRRAPTAIPANAE